MEHLAAVPVAPLPVSSPASMRRYRQQGILLMLLAALALGLLAFLRTASWPSSSIQHLASANAVMRQALITIDDYIEHHERIPVTLDEAGFTLPEYTPISRVEIQPESGVILVQLKAPDAALALVYARVAGEDDQPEWVCSGGPEVDPDMLPVGCGPAADTSAEQ